ncbi:MAG: putative membrane protein [Verrucomicrobiales bacterium]|jgi:uncharacterized membrane protein
MQPIFYAGVALIVLAIVVFLLEGKDLRGFGQMAAWFRMTVFVIGVVLTVWGLTAKTNAESGRNGV